MNTTDQVQSNQDNNNNELLTSVLGYDINELKLDDIVELPMEIFLKRPRDSKYIIEYHRADCIGATTCANIASNTFEMNDNNKADLITSDELDLDELILAAAQSCPVNAIVIRDAVTGEKIHPVE